MRCALCMTQDELSGAWALRLGYLLNLSPWVISLSRVLHVVPKIKSGLISIVLDNNLAGTDKRRARKDECDVVPYTQCSCEWCDIFYARRTDVESLHPYLCFSAWFKDKIFLSSSHIIILNFCKAVIGILYPYSLTVFSSFQHPKKIHDTWFPRLKYY